MRALRDMNLPKFVFEDVPLFLGLIGDLFPGLDCPRVRYPKFNDAVESILMENKYILLPNQVTLHMTLARCTCMCVCMLIHACTCACTVYVHVHVFHLLPYFNMHACTVCTSCMHIAYATNNIGFF